MLNKILGLFEKEPTIVWNKEDTESEMNKKILNWLMHVLADHNNEFKHRGILWDLGYEVDEDTTIGMIYGKEIVLTTRDPKKRSN